MVGFGVFNLYWAYEISLILWQKLMSQKFLQKLGIILENKLPLNTKLAKLAKMSFLKVRL